MYPTPIQSDQDHQGLGELWSAQTDCLVTTSYSNEGNNYQTSRKLACKVGNSRQQNMSMWGRKEEGLRNKISPLPHPPSRLHHLLIKLSQDSPKWRCLRYFNSASWGDLRRYHADFPWNDYCLCQTHLRGPKHHLKRLVAPKSWMLDKLGGVYAPRPSTGPHRLRECLPLVILLRNRLKYALTNTEVMKITMQRLIRVDGKIRTDRNFPTGFMGGYSYIVLSMSV
ncbi:40S ribosomal protein S4 [Portunus trituberculatus]|uniref:40S ribosomal protein S4 n=1 Tax=Portunus trituberculatus TaxID=210409 RepID=A0A5B7E337_PORTR|nr:40S ribosomal protein S4 [Portunus trituberculatus]